MRLASISVRNLRIRMVASVLTVLAIAVATGLYAAIMLMADQTRQRYEGSIGGYRAVLGPKDCSQLELLLNTIFNVGEAPGQVPLQVCEDLRRGRVSRRAAVNFAIPQARGDSISRYGFPVVGTTDEMFSAFQWRREPLRFEAGGPWSFSYEELDQLAEQLAAFETARRTEAQDAPARPDIAPQWRRAVVGSRVARTLGLSLGGTIVPVHGKVGEFGSHEHPEAACEIVGVLAPTNSPLDTTGFLPLGGQLLVGGHEGGLFKVEVPPGKNPDDAALLPVQKGQLALTAVLADPKDHFGAQFLRQQFGQRPDAQVAWPQDVIPKFLRQLGNAADWLEAVAQLVLFVAAMMIAVSIYNTMNERRREIAIMRSLGARRSQIAGIIVGEAALLSLLGALLGLVACHVLALLLRGAVEDMTGVWLDWTAFSVREVYLVAGTAALGAFAGLLPAAKGSTTQVADNLSQTY